MSNITHFLLIFSLHKLSFLPSSMRIGPPWLLPSPHFLPFAHSFFCSDFDTSILPCSCSLPILLTMPVLLSIMGACGGMLQSLSGVTCLGTVGMCLLCCVFQLPSLPNVFFSSSPGSVLTQELLVLFCFHCSHGSWSLPSVTFSSVA